MPLIAYQGAHGVTDFPHHFAFFGHLEQQGILDKYDFAVDPGIDPVYAKVLLHRFPQLQLVTNGNITRKAMLWMRHNIGRGYRPLSYLDTKFDAICEAPGGRVNEIYMKNDVFRHYPRIKRRAILFHSIENGALKTEEIRNSVAACDLVITRTPQSAENARRIGARWVVDSADIAFLEHPKPIEDRAGIAVSLRLPIPLAPPLGYMQTLRDIIQNLCSSGRLVDFVLVEEPLGAEMKLAGIGSYAQRKTGLYYNDTMYVPFLYRRDAIITSRLHTTLIGLLHGNRKFLQYHVEPGTNKMVEILGQMGLNSLKVHRLEDVSWAGISEFLEAPTAIPEIEAMSALEQSKARTLFGMQALFEWLHTIK